LLICVVKEANKASTNLKLDEKDKKIITLLSENPNVSQATIAMKINRSQPSVAMRLKRLKEMGAIANVCGMNPSKMGLYLAKVDITTNNTTKILDTFRGCPYFLNGFIVSGKSNLCLFFVGENIGTLEAIVDSHLRPHKKIQNVEFNIIVGVAKDLITPIKMNIESSDRPPCGIEFTCKDCSVYGDRCLGCPVTGDYRGSLW
jgi:Lrp/AsnC family leucine-responsive transcriptional regulator